MRIDELDKNFAVNLNLSKKDVKVYDVCDAPFSLHGLIAPKDKNDRFRRMPEEVAKSVSEGVYALHANTAGGRVRFKTDSDYIAIVAEMPANKIGKMPHFALTGSAGFDLYGIYDGEESYIKSFIPPFDIKDGYQSEFYIPNPEMRDYTINFPLYSDVSGLKIILSERAKVLAPDDYKIKVPVVYYGSSITQGGCASRPGNAYQAIITRALGCDHINLGFSGNAKGEKEIAEYIASLEMSAFVYDYDYNPPTVDHLEKTHEPMFDKVRAAHPDTPIICVSGIISHKFNNRDERRRVIIETVDAARAAGDKNVYFIDGRDFAKGRYAKDSLSVDGCHPNDYGFVCMAEKIGEVLKAALK